MPLAPRRPSDASPEEAERYARDRANFKVNPSAWGAEPDTAPASAAKPAPVDMKLQAALETERAEHAKTRAALAEVEEAATAPTGGARPSYLPPEGVLRKMNHDQLDELAAALDPPVEFAEEDTGAIRVEKLLAHPSYAARVPPTSAGDGPG